MTLKIEDKICLTIRSLGKNGEGIADYNGMPIFIDNALPGEILHVQITECRKNYYLARVLSIEKASPFRTAPPCPLFGRCGGCQLMHLLYSAQLKLKQQRVQTALQKHSLENNVLDCLPSPLPLNYRNKLQFPVEGAKIGLYAKSSHELIDIATCPVHCSLGDYVYQSIKPYLSNIKHLLIKTSIHLQEVLVTLVVKEADFSFHQELAKKIMGVSPTIKGVVLNISPQETNVILGKEYFLLAGTSYIKEKLGDLFFHISPASFFQVNTLQAELMYAKSVEIADLQGNEIVLDAFCGVGTLSLYFARHVKKIVGVECIPKAVEDATNNALLNHIDNAFFHTELAENFIQTIDKVDILILNPPRKGCAHQLLTAVKRLKPLKIIYISCDPETLARDLSFLISIGYLIEIVQPFDMFPQTFHVETLVLLKCV